MERSAGADHRHHAGADERVSAERVPGRHHRPALPAVRADDRRHGAHQRDQRRDAQAGPVRTVAAAAERRGRTSSTAGSTRSTTGSASVYMAITRVLVRNVDADDARVRRPDRRRPCGGTGACRRVLPNEDQGYVLVSVQLPDAASQPRTREVLKKIDDILREHRRRRKLVRHRRHVVPRATATRRTSRTLFVTFRSWDERVPKGLDARRDAGQAAWAASARSRKRSSSRFRRRRFAAWACAAASRCRCRTAATWAATRSARASTELVAGAGTQVAACRR